jgi:uncharacterized protein with ATP-grasp and redox domains
MPSSQASTSSSKRRTTTVDATAECTTCLQRQGADISRLLPAGPARRALLEDVARIGYQADLTRPPVLVAQAIHRRLRELAGDTDPYLDTKRAFNTLVLGLVPELRSMIRNAPDPLRMTTRLAIAANVIDLGPNAALTPADALAALRGVLDQPFREDWEAFVAALARARQILYLADNAGEIVVDRLLVEAIGPDKVTVVVRGGPVINDATIDDARQVGLDTLVQVIDNGSDAPGTVLEECSEAFRERFEAADLVVAKGQGNFESLSEVKRPMFFLFKVKCPAVATHAGLPLGTHALIEAARWQEAGG